MPQVIDFVIADAQASPAALVRIADVICLAGECACPRSWVSEALRRWPGCLVAVARAGERDCVAAGRGQPPVLLAVRAGSDGDRVLGCAVAAYWWIVSGRSLELLAGSHVVVVSGGAGSVPPSDASSPRTSSASGAAVTSNPARASER